MTKTYALRTEALAEVVASAPDSPKHTELLAALIARTEYRAARFIITREFSDQPARILDRDRNEIASDAKAWMREQLAACGGDHVRTWALHKDKSYFLTERRPLLLYLTHDRGGEQENFVQLEVWQEAEILACELFSKQEYDRPFDADELLDLRVRGRALDPVPLGQPRYRLHAANDVRAFLGEATALNHQAREATRGRLLRVTDRDTGVSRMTTFGEMHPEFTRYPWPGKRLFDDWTESSAGRSGARLCQHWVFRLDDYTDQAGTRSMSYIPIWGFNKPLTKLDRAPKSDYELYGKLETMDRRLGVPFGWYFYMLHGNRVQDWAGRRVLDAAEQGLIVLPEHDYRVLKRWGDQPYGF